ncbi:protein mono-ADP-ribosyltransferase PARP14-like isoform X3 [Xenia sp. Carnegie-2017]|uniref:protein mono-ADP-ribosyltransferase PARP14-like isoform X3 n=1 Tax=Xenia sp. Carnegie-2017 TaxID=2897299 RepID=UPI001F04BDE2|nr:protein mono-ADP-ribosyltransferase PARP14-like isoform X3 [Xenia sp. Carnegie-2017]
MSALSLKNERTILVSGLPDSATSKRVTMHFQKTKNGGGDIKEVKMLGQGNARVTFVDRTVAKRVLEVEQIFEATILNVQLEENELFQNVEIGKRKVLVSGLPEDITENAVKIHFQKKRNSGGDVEKVNLLKDGFAEIVFEKAEVASQVVHTQQIMKGKILNVELMENETFEREENDVYEETSDKISRSVVVSSLPEGVKKNNLHIHFQKKKNGGGDISEVQIFPDKNQALVVFDDIQVARRVVKTEQRIHGNILNLELQNDFLSKTNEITTKERTIIISDLPNDFTENDVKFHFEKKQHVDEDLGRKVEVLFIGSTALVVFENGEEAKKAAETAQIVRGETLDVNLFKEQNLADELIKKYDQNSHETMTSTHSIEKETKSEISYDSSGDHLNNEKEAENLNGAKYWKSGVTNNNDYENSSIVSSTVSKVWHVDNDNLGSPEKGLVESFTVNSLFLRYIMTYHYEIIQNLESVSKKIEYQVKPQNETLMKIILLENVDERKYISAINDFIDFYQKHHEKMVHFEIDKKDFVNEIPLKHFLIVDSLPDKTVLFGKETDIKEAEEFLKRQNKSFKSQNQDTPNVYPSTPSKLPCPSSPKVNQKSQAEVQSVVVYQNAKISVYQNNITKELVDVIVNPANEDLNHYGGAAKAIVDAGGFIIQIESDEIIRKRGSSLKPGDVKITGPGKLHCNYIFTL